MDAKKLRQFATLAVRRGVNVKPGQDVIVHAELDQPEFITMVVEEAYAAGARSVRVKWTHQPISRVNALEMKEEVMAEIRSTISPTNSFPKPNTRIFPGTCTFFSFRWRMICTALLSEIEIMASMPGLIFSQLSTAFTTFPSVKSQ